MEIVSFTSMLIVVFISLFDALFTEIAAEPAFFAVTTPVFSTVTIFGLLDVYINVLSVAFSGRTVELIT